VATAEQIAKAYYREHMYRLGRECKCCVCRSLREICTMSTDAMQDIIGEQMAEELAATNDTQASRG
jgi:hypothetical protein